MRKPRIKFIWVRLCVLSVAALICASCFKRQEASGMITESKAVEVAKKEFARTGRRVEDYRVSVETDSTGRKWLIWFERKGDYAPVGGKHFLTVEKFGGKAIFMPGE